MLAQVNETKKDRQLRKKLEKEQRRLEKKLAKVHRKIEKQKRKLEKKRRKVGKQQNNGAKRKDITRTRTAKRSAVSPAAQRKRAPGKGPRATPARPPADVVPPSPTGSENSTVAAPAPAGVSKDPRPSSST
jgi:hypothetical protein